MQLLINNNTDPYFNLALEELIASSYLHEVVMLWRNRPSIIVGRNQNTEAEINAEAVRQKGINVVRRVTGGGAVYHDLGNINYTIAANDRQLDSDAFARNAGIIIKALQKFDINAEFKGRNDILVNGRKISGSAKSVFRDRTLFHGTLLFDTDLSVLSSVLTPDKKKIEAKGIKSVRSRVANLKEFLPLWDVDIFWDRLAETLLEIMHLDSVTSIPDEFVKQAESLADEKYRTWEWNFGSAIGYSYKFKDRFAGGTVEVNFNVRDNLIYDLKFSGDFFSIRPVEELAEKINGTSPRFDAVAGKLAAIDISEFFVAVSKDELLSLFRLG